MKRFILICLWLVGYMLGHSTASAETPDFMLLNNYTNQDVSGWVMSEKLDGVRGYWDGTRLFTRGGVVLQGFSAFCDRWRAV